MDFVDLPKASGKRNNPGMSSKMWLLPISELESIPAPPTWAAPGDSLKISGAITVKTPESMGFREVYTTPRSNSLAMEMVGQIDSKSMDLKFEFERPGFDAGFLEFLLEDRDYILAIAPPDCLDKTLYIIGAPCNPVKVEGSFASGKMGETDSKRAWTGVATFQGVDIRVLDSDTYTLPMLPGVEEGGETGGETGGE